jgi:hypothetical protein
MGKCRARIQHRTPKREFKENSDCEGSLNRLDEKLKN